MANVEDSGWRFQQVFGDKGNVEDIAEADIISALEFDHTGEFLATGDRGGRVVLFERDSTPQQFAEYQFYTEFQSHELEFDTLKSAEIEEKINSIKWLKRTNQARFLLSTNDKTVKLWKIYEKQMHSMVDPNFPANGSPAKTPIRSLKVPKLTSEDTIYATVPRRVYPFCHQYHIHSLSVNSDEEHFISADDLRINLWNLSTNHESFNIVDIKPANMEELTEVITSAHFHPTSCNVLMYSTSKGGVKLVDMRDHALCDSFSKAMQDTDDQKSFFSEIVMSITDAQFSHSGRYIATRNYMTVKVWDVNMEKAPVCTFPVHEYLRPQLCELYENDCIFDRFGLSWNGNDSMVMTGSYNHLLSIMDVNKKSDALLEARTMKKKSPMPLMSVVGKKKPGSKTELTVDSMDFNKKTTRLSFHPKENLVAVAATTNLFLFAKP